MSFSWILSQIFVFLEYVLLGASYLAKNRKAVVLLDIASMSFGIIGFLLLGADLGMAMSVIILLANFYYLWDESKHSAKERQRLHARDYVVLVLVLTSIVVLSIIINEGWIGVFSIAATGIYEVSIWQKSTKVYKFLGIPVAGCWMLYNAFEHSPVGVLSESIMLIASTVGFVIEIAQARKQTAKLASTHKKSVTKPQKSRPKTVK